MERLARQTGTPSNLLTSGVALVLAATYVATAAPGLAWNDAGELISAAHAIGVAHPTGFPLWIILAKGAALLPVGSIALRVTLLGAACLSAASVLAGLLAVRLLNLGAPRDTEAAADGAASGSSQAGSIATVLTFCTASFGLGLSAACWRHATSAEVYCLHVLLVVLLLYGLLRLLEAPSLQRVGTAALLAGLALANHGEARLLLALWAPLTVAVLWLGVRRGDLPRPAAAALPPLKSVALAVGMGLVGLLSYVLLPLRAAAGTAALWDDVSSWPLLLRHLKAERIFLAFGDQMFALGGPRAAYHLELLTDRLAADAGLLPLLALLGVLALFRSSSRDRGDTTGAEAATLERRPHTFLRRSALCLLLGGLAVDLGYTMWINPMGLPDAQVLQVTVAMLAVLAGVGAGDLSRCGRPALLRSAAVLVCILSLAHLARVELPDKAHPGMVAPAAMADDALATAAPHAVLLVNSDSLAAGLLHHSLVEGARPDVRVAVRQHLWHPAGRRQVQDLLPADAQPPYLEPLIRAQLGRRQIRWEHGGGADEPPYLLHLVPGLATWRLSPRPAAEPRPVDLEALQHALLRWVGDAPLTSAGRKTFTAMLDAVAWHEASAGRWQLARKSLDLALRLEPDSFKSLVNLGAVASRQGRMDEAAWYNGRAAQLKPCSVVAQVNQGRYLLALQRFAEAERAFRLALEVNPDSVGALAGLGAAVANQRRYDEAEQLLRRALALQPDHEEARVNLNKVLSLGRAPGASR